MEHRYFDNILTKEDSMKKLEDLCLSSIAKHMCVLTGLGRYLAPVNKEKLLERMALHDLLTPEYLPHITYNLITPALKVITFYSCEQINDSVLRTIGNSGCQLEQITVHRCGNVTDIGAQAITSGQTNLQVLKFRKLHKLTALSLKAVDSRVLHSVDISGSVNITSEGVKNLVMKNPTIKELALAFFLKLDNAVFPVIATSLQENLESLDVSNLHTISDSSLSAIAEHCPNLKRLDLHGSNRIGEEGMTKLVQHCQKLEKLDLSFCSKLDSFPASNCLRDLPTSLSHLSLCGVMVEDQRLLVEAIVNLPKLKSIRLSGVPAVTDDTLKEILKEIGGSLELLDLSGSPLSTLSDHGLRAVSKYCLNLKKLYLNLIRSITGATLLPMIEDMERAKNLEILKIGCPKMSLELMYAVASNCSGLTCLVVSGLTIVDDILVTAIADSCPLLNYVGLKGCTQVSDLGVCELARCCPLQVAVLAGLNKLTDKSIFALANSCAYLEEIYLSGCSMVTSAALHYLQDCCIPRIYIDHKVPNVSPNQIMAKNLDTGEFCRADLLPTS